LKTIFFISRALKKSEKNLKNGKKNSLNTLIAGITVGVSAMIMICAVSISDGFEKEIRDKAVGYSGEIIVNSGGFDINHTVNPITLPDGLIGKLGDIEGVKSVSQVCYKPGIIKGRGNIQGIIFKGVGSDYDWSFFKKALSGGSLPQPADSVFSDKILISARLSDILGYSSGDTLLVYFVDNSVRARRLVVSGIYDAQLEETDKTTVAGDIALVRNLNGWNENMVSDLELRLDGRIDPKVVQMLAEKEIISLSGDEVRMSVTNVRNIYPNLFDWLRLLDFNVLVVLVLMTIVAGFTMLSGVLIIIFEKIPVIGIFKAMGMKDSTIHKIFLTASAGIVLRGMTAGTIAAVLLCLMQKYFKIITLNPSNYFVKYIPTDLNFLKILALDAGIFLIIMLFLYIPLRFIASVNPADTVKMK
jgi:lipoprotein-releasing system permease protein